LVLDAWNRLVVVKSGSTTLEAYTYDGLGRRITENPGTLQDIYFSSAWQVLEEDVAGSMQDQYVWSAVYVDAMTERDTPTQRLYVQQDANWNVTALVNTSGSVVERYVYDPYGAVTYLTATWGSLSGSAYAWHYLFQDGRQDQATRLYNFQHRDYSATLARWISADPLRYDAGDTNLYRFAADAPVDYVDPGGREVVIVLKTAHSPGGLPVGTHITIVVKGTSAGSITFNGGGGFSSGSPNNPKPHMGINVPQGQEYPVTTPQGMSPDEELKALMESYMLLHQVPYSATGPNSNTYANQLLKLSGFTVPEGSPPTQTWGWTDPAYGGHPFTDHDQYGQPRPPDMWRNHRSGASGAW
jgi:RHS repeat-associated protein